MGHRMIKKLLISICLVLLLPVTAFSIGSTPDLDISGYVAVVSPTSPTTPAVKSAGVDYSHILLFLTGDGAWDVGVSYTLDGSECSSLTDADDACAINGAFAEETVAPIVGGSSFKTVDAQDYCTFDHVNAMPKGRLAAWVKLPTGVAGSSLPHLHDDAPVNRTGLAHLDDDQVTAYIYDDGTPVININSTITKDFDDTAHFVELPWDYSVGDGSDYARLIIDNVLEDEETALTIDEAMTWRWFILGNKTANAGAHITDQIILSDDPTISLYPLRNLASAPAGACP